MAQAAEGLARLPEHNEKPSLILSPTQNEQLFGSLSKCFRVTHPNEEYVDSMIQIGQLPLVPLSW
jgi:hypothetical protein